MDLTIETKCWENDWHWVLNPARMRALLERCGSDRSKHVVWLNNGDSLNDMRRAADALVSMGLVDEYDVVADWADEALDFFGIDPESFFGGYHYSIAELVGLYRCNTKFLMHFSGDSMPLPGLPDAWVQTLLSNLDAHDDWLVANLLWNGRLHEARREATQMMGMQYEWAVGFGFSDQMYLVRAADFKAPIYSHTHEAGERYPKYGGNLFEKRVDAYMRTHQRLRATWVLGSYLHKNYPRRWYQRLLWKAPW
jgi:hypothetical protein